MNLWPVEHFFEHIRHHFWVGLLLHPLRNLPNLLQNMSLYLIDPLAITCDPIAITHVQK